jgi:hypothetical protein
VHLPKRTSANDLVGGAIVCFTIVVASLSFAVRCGLSSSSGDTPGDYFAQLIVDLRSLAIGRIFIGIMILLDLRERLMDLVPFYTDAGCCPRHVLLAPGGEPRLASADISFYFATGSNATTLLLMLGLGGVSSLCFLVGYQTRLATLGCWLHWRSIETRTVAVHQAGDLLLRLLLWWCLFLPMGALYSIDAQQNEDATPSVASKLPAFGLMLQMSLMYFMTVMFKVDSSWKDGTAIRLILLSYGFSRSSIASWVLSLPKIVTWGLTKATVWVEFAVLPLLLLVTAPSLRLLLALTLMGFHFGIGLTMRLGLFPAISIGAWLLLIPGFVWDTLLGTVPTADDSERDVPQTMMGYSWMEVVIMCISIILSVRTNLAKLPTARLRATLQVSKQKAVVATWSNRIYFLVADQWCRTSTTQGILEIELCRLLGQNQQWFMFDVPARTDWWVTSVGHCEDGSQIDLFGSHHHGTTLLPVLTSPPPRWQVAYRSHRWRKFLFRLCEKRYATLRVAYAQFLAKRWNATAVRGKTVKRVELHCVKRRINLADEKAVMLEQSAMLWSVDIKSAT